MCIIMKQLPSFDNTQSLNICPLVYLHSAALSLEESASLSHQSLLILGCLSEMSERESFGVTLTRSLTWEAGRGQPSQQLSCLITYSAPGYSVELSLCLYTSKYVCGLKSWARCVLSQQGWSSANMTVVQIPNQFFLIPFFLLQHVNY